MSRREKENEGEGEIMEEGQCIAFANEFSELSGVKEILWNPAFNGEFQSQIPFLYETAIIYGLNVLKPWENPGQFIPSIMDEWGSIKEELHKRFTRREQNGIPELMKRGMAFFYECVFWCNHKAVVLKREQLIQLRVKPINAVERLSFIASRPSNYHSYVQLSELFIELEKIYSKEQLMKKASKP
jgi:hypothetical protein